ncbi:MAG: DoxX family protein [Bacteriovorax sp.]|nr:DoxX family protein [Bacteriovorax sp.]
MLNYAVFAQIIIAISIVVVWVGRFDNIVKEFEYFHLSTTVRNIVGATKISLATFLIIGIWYPELVLIPALIMAALMIGAQLTHFRVRNPWYKYLPSLVLLILSLFTAAVHAGKIV